MQGDSMELEALEALEGELADDSTAQPTGGTRMLRAVQVLMQHRGPIPSEQWLTTVEQLEPGTTRRMVDDFINEREHQRTMQSQALEIDRENFRSFQRYQHWQLFAAWSIVILIAIGGIVLIALGQSIAGLIALVSELAVLAGVFLGRQVIQSRGSEQS
jgi:uncharacterized membrane protein